MNGRCESFFSFEESIRSQKKSTYIFRKVMKDIEDQTGVEIGDKRMREWGGLGGTGGKGDGEEEEKKEGGEGE